MRRVLVVRAVTHARETHSVSVWRAYDEPIDLAILFEDDGWLDCTMYVE